jgi:hypothetical protein
MASPNSVKNIHLTQISPKANTVAYATVRWPDQLGGAKCSGGRLEFVEQHALSPGHRIDFHFDSQIPNTSSANLAYALLRCFSYGDMIALVSPKAMWKIFEEARDGVVAS